VSSFVGDANVEGKIKSEEETKKKQRKEIDGKTII
jgi:hypothetical protein